MNSLLRNFYFLGGFFVAVGCGGAAENNGKSAGSGGAEIDGGSGGERSAGSGGDSSAAAGGSGSSSSDGGTSSNGGSFSECMSGEYDERYRCEAEQVEPGEVCQCETQRRDCEDDVWGGWTGHFTELQCAVEAPSSCGDEAHGTILTRTRYLESSVAVGQTCEVEAQTSVCNDGAWSEWTGSFSEVTCVVDTPTGCGYEERTRYAAVSVPFGGTCASEVQTRTCVDGAWGSWSGAFAESSCSVQGPASCGGQPHGTAENRTRFESALVTFGAECVTEQQSRSCSNGAWSAWSGTFAAASCAVDPATDPFDGVGQPCEVLGDCRAGLTCHDDKTTFRSHRQCTDTCASESECNLAYGASTTCLSTGVCAAECIVDQDCPPDSLCNSEGWCSRTGPGTGNPSCGGTATACSTMGGTTCNATPFGCTRVETDSCKGEAIDNCSTHFTFSPCDDQGCIWNVNTMQCSGPPQWACSELPPHICENILNCYVKTTVSCEGTAPACVAVPLDMCDEQPGCSAVPAN